MFTLKKVTSVQYSLFVQEGIGGGNRELNWQEKGLNIARDLGSKGGSSDIKSLEDQYRNDPNSRTTLDLLRDTGMLESRSILSGRQREQYQSIKAALEASSKDGKHRMIVFSGTRGYQVYTVDAYRALLKNDIKEINTSIIQSIFSSPVNRDKYKNILDESTWEDLALYLTSRKASGEPSRLFNGIDPKVYEPFFDEHFKRRKQKEQASLDALTRTIGRSPETREAFNALTEKNGIKIDDSGRVDIDTLFQGIFLKNKERYSKLGEKELAQEIIKDINAIKQELESTAKMIKSQRESIINELGWKTTRLEQIPTLRSIPGLSRKIDGSSLALREKTLLGLTKNEARILFREVQEKNDGSNPLERGKLLLFLGLHARLSEVQNTKAQVDATGKKLSTSSISVNRSSSGDLSINIDEKTRASIAGSGKVAEELQGLEDARSVLGKITLEGAQKELALLENKTNLTEEEQARRTALLQYIEKNGRVSRVYRDLKTTLGEEEAKLAFSYGFESSLSGRVDRQITIDFSALEKNGIKSDWEIPKGEKTLLLLEPKTEISFTKILDGSNTTSIMSAPEFADISILRSDDGNSYQINTGRETLTQLSFDQVKEYRDVALMYADLGLSQFIPLIPRITRELQQKGVSTGIDGSLDTMEQQKVLKYLYKLLFGSELLTNNVHEVEAAFRRSLGSPSNMKNAMQHTLKIHGLIPESSAPIRPDTLIEWIRKNRDFDPSSELLKNL